MIVGKENLRSGGIDKIIIFLFLYIEALDISTIKYCLNTLLTIKNIIIAHIIIIKNISI